MEHIDFNLDWKFYKTHGDWEDEINVSIFGDSDAVIQGIGTARPYSNISFGQLQQKLYRGRCLVVVRSGTTKGDVEIKVEASKKENILYKIKLN